MDVNALNFCRFSLLKSATGSEKEPKALIALPNLVDSSTVWIFILISFGSVQFGFSKADIWSLPSRDRIHATIGQEIQKSIFSANPGGRNTSGLFFLKIPMAQCITSVLIPIFQEL